jgi:exopolysaccharide biosynthesis polyprenyl glycosylphosphotransferase
VAAFHESPVEVRLKLSPASPQSQFAAARLGAAIGSIGLNRAGQALTDADRVVKRACDLAVGAVALVLVAPLMAAVALAIKLDSPGPVFFVQTRRGYNKQLFRIIKFRTMTAIENGRRVAQAKARDCRVTRMGRWMRRYNVDELPQLINVLKGEMSLVGPRPHAIPHDRQFAREVPFYTRRTTVMPGMTGWAQVNGHRGAIDTFEHIERRVEHDLHYIDNWSPLFDLWIMAMTLFSRNAYRNAL